jgi:hypothetical protein
MTRPTRAAAVALLLVSLPQSACGKKQDASAADRKRDDKKQDDKKQEAQPGHDKLAPPPIGGPITTAQTLLEYTWWPDAPDFCRTPEALLNHLDDVLDSGECMAQLNGVKDRAKVSMTCRAHATADPSDTSNCVVEYEGRLWVVRSGNSETDYSLFGQGSLSRICTTADGRERPTESKPSDVFAQQQASKSLEDHLKPCRAS